MFKTMLAGMSLAAATAALAQTPDHARDGVQTRAAVTQRIAVMFQRLDSDRDGLLTQQEVAAVRTRAHAHRTDPARRQIRLDRAFARLDLNQDGSISRQEFGKARSTRDQARAGRAALPRPFMAGRIFTMADADRDQRVSLQEATAAALGRFDRLDLNRDGQLTREERIQAREHRRQQKRG